MQNVFFDDCNKIVKEFFLKSTFSIYTEENGTDKKLVLLDDTKEKKIMNNELLKCIENQGIFIYDVKQEKRININTYLDNFVFGSLIKSLINFLSNLALVLYEKIKKDDVWYSFNCGNIYYLDGAFRIIADPNLQLISITEENKDRITGAFKVVFDLIKNLTKVKFNDDKQTKINNLVSFGDSIFSANASTDVKFPSSHLIEAFDKENNLSLQEEFKQRNNHVENICKVYLFYFYCTNQIFSEISVNIDNFDVYNETVEWGQSPEGEWSEEEKKKKEELKNRSLAESLKNIQKYPSMDLLKKKPKKSSSDSPKIKSEYSQKFLSKYPTKSLKYKLKELPNKANFEKTVDYESKSIAPSHPQLLEDLHKLRKELDEIHVGLEKAAQVLKA
jgi:hypothetical protein